MWIGLRCIALRWTELQLVNTRDRVRKRERETEFGVERPRKPQARLADKSSIVIIINFLKILQKKTRRLVDQRFDDSILFVRNELELYL